MSALAKWIASYGHGKTKYYMHMCYSADTLAPALVRKLQTRRRKGSQVWGATGEIRRSVVRVTRSKQWYVNAGVDMRRVESV